MIREQSVPRRESVGLKRYADALAPYTLTILRVLVGITFLLHGLPKFGDNLVGFTGFVASLGVPAPGFFAIVVAVLEVGGGLLLIAGLAVRWVSLLFVIEMLVATLLFKLPNLGFIAPPNAPTAGAELDLLLLVSALVLFAHGPGPLSVERDILKREL
jgi:putative oxidoreductase